VTAQNISENGDSSEALERLAVQIQERLGPASAESDRFMRGAYEALIAIEEPRASPTRIRALLALAQYRYLRADEGNRLGPSEMAVALARETGDDELLRRALSIHGAMLSEGDAIGASMSHYAQAVAAAQRTGDARQEAVVWHNLASTMLGFGAYRDALAMIERTLTLLDACERTSKNDGFYWNALVVLATALFHLQETSKGLVAIRTALDRMPPLSDANDYLSAAQLHQQYVYLLLKVDNVPRAEQHAARALEMANACGYARARIVAELAQGLVEVQSGFVDRGLGRLTAALEASYPVSTGTIKDSLWALVKAHEITGNREQATRYMGELVSSLMQAALTSSGKLYQHLLSQNIEPQAARMTCLDQMAIAAQLSEEPSGEHAVRVAELADRIAQDLGLPNEERELICLAARWHDVGKIAIPQEIMLKPDRLTNAERQVMQQHAQISEAILSSFDDPKLSAVAKIVSRRHETWNGRGSPAELKEDATERAARIVGLAEVFDTLLHSRPYKEPWPMADAIEEIWLLAGRTFDPELVSRLVKIVNQLQRDHGDAMSYLALDAQESEYVAARRSLMRTLRESRLGVAAVEA